MSFLSLFIGLLIGCILGLGWFLMGTKVFNYGTEKPREQRILDNDEINLHDKFYKLISWILVAKILLLIIGIPFSFMHWGVNFQIYLVLAAIFILPGLLVLYKAVPKLKKNTRIMRMKGLIPMSVLVVMVWPVILYIWKQLEGSIPDYERIKHINSI